MNSNLEESGLSEPPDVCYKCGSRFCDCEIRHNLNEDERVELDVAVGKAENVRNFVALMIEDLKEGRLDPLKAESDCREITGYVAETRALLDEFRYEIQKAKALVSSNGRKNLIN